MTVWDFLFKGVIYALKVDAIIFVVVLIVVIIAVLVAKKK